MTTSLDRRTFLKHAGMGTVVLAGAPVLAGMGASPAMADEEQGIGFFFAAADSAGSVRTTASPDVLIMDGCGHFDEHSSHISGNGFFTHYDGSAPVPKPVKASGLWEAHRLLSFHSIVGSFGVQLAGIMVANVTLLKQVPEPEAVIPATLTVVCNIAQAGLITTEDEGFQLVVPSLGLSFQPLMPTVGISGFDRSLAEEH